MLLAIFAAVAVLIAAVGIYGVMAYSTSQRSREMGIRMALGSSAQQIFKLVVWDGMKITVFGIVIGAVGAFILGRYLTAMLFSISTLDPLTLATATIAIATVGLIASLVPARKASRLSLSETLREN
jgi:ABC-type antimicrobial peptide transport system permease subunit